MGGFKGIGANIRPCLAVRVFLVLCFVVLSACGGGGGGTPAAQSTGNTAPPPASGAVLTSITVSPSNSIVKVGDTLQMSAIGHYDDGGEANLSGSVIWSSVGGDATVNSSGLATGVSSGFSLISAIHSASATQGATTLYSSIYGLEGSVANPVVLSVDSPYSGQVNFGGTGTGNGYSYYAVNVTPGSAYYVFLTGLDGNAQLELYDDIAFTNSLCTSEENAQSDELCFAEGPANGVLYIAVNGDDTRLDTHQGASYSLNVRAGFKDEGTWDALQSVNLNTAYNGQVGRSLLNAGVNGTSIYTTSFAATGRYTISVTNPSDDISLMVLNPFSVVECMTNTSGLADESCSFQAEEVPLRVLISSENTTIGASFNLTITENHGAYVAEGTSATPLNLSAFPHAGEVGGITGWTNSYYSVPVTAMQSVRVQATNLDDRMSLSVYDGDSSFTTPSCTVFSSNTADIECLLEPVTSGTLYIKTSTNSGIGTSYSLNVSAINYPAEGTSVSPSALSVAPTYDAIYAASVDATSSYYAVPVSSGKLYQMGLANVSGDVSLSVYGDASLTNLLCASNNVGLVDEFCQATPTSGNLWLAIAGDTYGAKFDLTVDRVYAQQGEKIAPLDITASLPTYTNGETAGASGNAGSTHLQATLIAGKSYQFEISNNTDDSLELYVYDGDPDFSFPYACSSRATAVNTAFSCTIDPHYASTVYIIVLSRKPFGSEFDLTISEVAFNTEGSVGSPVNIGVFPVAGTVGVSRLEYTGGSVDATESYYVADISAGYDYVNYTVELTNQSADVDLYIYDDASYSNLLCSSVATGTADELCSNLTPVANSLYIKVSGASSGFGGVYDLIVDHDYATEGAVSTGNGGNLTYNAVALNSGVTYQGQADGFASSYYYLPSSLSVAGSYTITVSNMLDSACVFLYDEIDGKITTSPVASNTNKGITPDKTFTTLFIDGVFVAVNGCGSTVTGTAFDISITAN